MKTDVAIIGGGPAGACAALYLKRHGIESTIVEKVPLPRYHIGDATTGESLEPRFSGVRVSELQPESIPSSAGP